MPDHKWFGGKLKELREKAGLSQVELAAKVDMNKDGIARLERGERFPGWKTVCVLAELFHVNLGEFGQPPARSVEPKRGRPPKPKLAEPAPKRPRGRPRKIT